MAPEVVRGGNLGHDIAVDWWSVGVLTYELLTGASPFTVEGEKNTQQEISKRILRCEPPMPDFLSKDVSDFILRLLVKDPRQRMGGGPTDAEEVKAHKFFRTINWDDLLRKNIPAPFVPRISSDTDVSNFSEEFTSMIPADSPGITPPNVEKVFKGYSYVAPSVLFSENCISEDIFKPSPDKRPSVSNLVGMKIKKTAFFQKYRIDLKEKILGDGSFSVCRRCINIATQQEYAVKIISRRVDASQEVRLLEACQGHPGVVTLVEVLMDQCHTYSITELLKGGELFQRIKRKRKFTEAEASGIMSKLISVVNYMHSLGVVHRDLKPENLLFDSTAEDAQLKVVDFGFARLKPEMESGMLTPCFSLPYAAPEVLDTALRTSQEGYNESCDLWSLGVILVSHSKIASNLSFVIQFLWLGNNCTEIVYHPNHLPSLIVLSPVRDAEWQGPLLLASQDRLCLVDHAEDQGGRLQTRGRRLALRLLRRSQSDERSSHGRPTQALLDGPALQLSLDRGRQLSNPGEPAVPSHGEPARCGADRAVLEADLRCLPQRDQGGLPTHTCLFRLEQVVAEEKTEAVCIERDVDLFNL